MAVWKCKLTLDHYIVQFDLDVSEANDTYDDMFLRLTTEIL